MVDPVAKERTGTGNGFHSTLGNKITSGEVDIALLNANFTQFAELIPRLRALSPAEQIERSVKQIAKES